jgi:hypothetical protein
MNDNRHRKNGLSLTTSPGPELRHPSFDAALEAARPALVRLYATWHQGRKAQIAEYVATFSSTHGCPPTADDVVAGVEPPISRSAATWYLVRNNGHHRACSTPDSILDFSKCCN